MSDGGDFGILAHVFGTRDHPAKGIVLQPEAPLLRTGSPDWIDA